MPLHNVNLSPELESLVLANVESGRYHNAADVIAAALLTLDREERERDSKLASLRDAIDDGDASGVAEGNSFDRVRHALKISEDRNR
jgi:antitoxin ParD1/3/4